MKKAFTIIELLLAMALMTSLLVTSGIVFRVAVKSHMTASATAEISRKLRGITDQLNADFKGLRKDGEIFITWVPNPLDINGKSLLGKGAPATAIDRYERFDRIMFFADGDFQSYNEWPDHLDPVQDGRVIHGSTARIVYMLAKDNIDYLDAGGQMVLGNNAESQEARKRILGRSQHIFTADSRLVDDPLDPALTRIRWINPANILNQLALPETPGLVDLNGAFTQANENYYEFDNLTLNEWLNLPPGDKQEMLTVISGQKVYLNDPDGNEPTEFHGMAVNVDSKPPLNVHQLLCEGVGEFSVQGWYEDPLLGPRWYPQLDLDRDGVIADEFDTDFIFDPDTGGLDESNPNFLVYNPQMEDYRKIPGLGRALKFTFTLYDSRGVFKDGKKFTHIVYLDE